MARTKGAAHRRLEAIVLTAICVTHTRSHTHQERPICQAETDGGAFRKPDFKLDHTPQELLRKRGPLRDLRGGLRVVTVRKAPYTAAGTQAPPEQYSAY